MVMITVFHSFEQYNVNRNLFTMFLYVITMCFCLKRNFLIGYHFYSFQENHNFSVLIHSFQDKKVKNKY